MRKNISQISTRDRMSRLLTAVLRVFGQRVYVARRAVNLRRLRLVAAAERLQRQNVVRDEPVSVGRRRLVRVVQPEHRIAESRVVEIGVRIAVIDVVAESKKIDVGQFLLSADENGGKHQQQQQTTVNRRTAGRRKLRHFGARIGSHYNGYF